MAKQPGARLKTEMMQAAIAAYPNEACGFIVARGKKCALRVCRNASPDPQNEFLVHPDDQLATEQSEHIVGVFHSHTNRSATPSDADRAGCEMTGLPWFILGITQNYNPEIDAVYRFSTVECLEPDGFEMALVGRPYVFGVFDCWLLCRDYLLREFGARLDALPALHVVDWFEGNVDILGDNYEAQHLVKMPPNTPLQRGDILFMQLGSKMPDHCAVYTGGGLILHHLTDRLSCHAVYGGQWQKHTTHHLRHQDLLGGVDVDVK